jgi:hypothetical protein
MRVLHFKNICQYALYLKLWGIYSLRTEDDIYHQGQDTEIAEKCKIVETY